MSEASLRNRIRRYLKKYHSDVFVQSFQATTQNGVPDLLLIMAVPTILHTIYGVNSSKPDIRYVWIELKAEKRFKVGNLQLWFRDKVRSLGGESYIINTMDSFKQIMNAEKVEECI